MSQNEKVLRHLRTHGSITTMDAFLIYGITRLSARISDLKAQGVEITSQTEKARNRDGRVVYFDRYMLGVKK